MSLGVSPIARITKKKEGSKEDKEIPASSSFQKYPRIFSKRIEHRRNRKLSKYPYLDPNNHGINNFPESKNQGSFMMKIITSIEEKITLFYGIKLIKIDSITIGRVIIND